MYMLLLSMYFTQREVPEAGILSITVSFSTSPENSAWPLISDRMAESKLGKPRRQRPEGAEGSRGMEKLRAGESRRRGKGRGTGTK